MLTTIQQTVSLSSAPVQESIEVVENIEVTPLPDTTIPVQESIETVDDIEVTPLTDATPPVHEAPGETNTSNCPKHLCQRHYEELLSSSISQSIIEKNFRTITDSREVDRLLNRNAKRRTKHSDHLVPAWAVTGLDPLGWERIEDGVQIKPDNPEVGENGKAQKYIGATGYNAAPLFLETDDIDYWDKVRKDLSIELFITEGAKKAAAGLSIDLATISIPGVSTCRKLGRLHRHLELFCKFGRTVNLCFDNDAMTKKPVQLALLSMAREISAAGGKVMVVMLPPGEAKGMDDFINQHGEEEFKKLVDDALTIEEFRKELEAQWAREASGGTTDKETPSKPIQAKSASQQLAEDYREKWKYDLQHQSWRQYDGKDWLAVTDKVFDKAVYEDMKSMPGVNYENYSYIDNVVKFLALELQVVEWISHNRAEWISFDDCVLEVATGKRHDHSPHFMFTSHLKHKCPDLKWNEGGDLLTLLRIAAPAFYAWAMYAQGGDALKVFKLLAILNGVLTYRFADLQMFVMLIGVPGSGKGTFARLLETAVGKQNHASAKLHRLGEDNVIASIIDKQLVICPDEKKQPGDISGLLSLTGGDSIAYRQIYKPMSSGKFGGALVVLANNNPFVGDITGVDRRTSMVQFNNPLPARDTEVERKMQAEVGILISLSLSMSRVKVEGLLRGTGDGEIPDFKRRAWLHKTENDSIALFMEEMLIPSPGNTYTMLGGKGDDATSLYGAYVKFCEENNSRNAFTKNNFRSHLIELCREVGWDSVRESRCGAGWRIYGISIRGTYDDTPRISDYLGGVQTPGNECRPGVDIGVDLKPLLGKDRVGDVDFSNPNNNIADEPPVILEENHKNKLVDEPEVYTPTQPIEDKGSEETEVCIDPSPPPVEPTLEQQIADSWKETSILGQIILSIAETLELQEITRNYTDAQIQYIKDAANSVWCPGCNSYGEYCGEKVEMMSFGHASRQWGIKTKSGSTIYVARGSVCPWLGIVAPTATVENPSSQTELEF